MASDPLRLIERFKDRNITLSVAESCTGGLISSMITECAGSSSVFQGSVVSYSNRSKMNILGVRETTLEEHGAVSQETAEEMVSGVKRIFDTDVAASVTGIAGPSGATDSKPVGLVYVAIATSSDIKTSELRLNGSRKDIQKAAADFVINRLMDVVG